MKYRDIEYPVVQGIERGVWEWSTLVDDMMTRGQAAIKSDAVAAAEKAIDRALSENGATGRLPLLTMFKGHTEQISVGANYLLSKII